MRLDGVNKERVGRRALRGAGGNRRPDALAPLTAFLAPGPLGDVAIDHHKANGLFGKVVGRPNFLGRDEFEIGAAAFLDAHRLADYLDLLDHAGRFLVRRQHAAAIGAGLERLFVRGVDLLGRKGRALVFGMARLAPLGAFVTSVRLGGLGGFTISLEGGLDSSYATAPLPLPVRRCASQGDR